MTGASTEKELPQLQAQVETRLDDAKACFDLGSAYDFLGRESEALHYYEKALALGFEKLPPEDRPRLFIQVGSTLRNLRQYSRAKAILQEGIENFPDVAALKAFLGLTEYSDGDTRRAAKLFLQAALHASQDESLLDYARALRNYSDQIDAFPGNSEDKK